MSGSAHPTTSAAPDLIDQLLEKATHVAIGSTQRVLVEGAQEIRALRARLAVWEQLRPDIERVCSSAISWTVVPRSSDYAAADRVTRTLKEQQP